MAGLGQFGPIGLVTQSHNFADIAVTVTGASTSAAAGTVTATVPSVLLSQFSVLGLSTKPRVFTAAPIPDVAVNITGAAIEGQVAHPDSSNANIYVDQSDVAGEAGSTEEFQAFVSGAAIAAEAGTVSVRIDVVVELFNPLTADPADGPFKDPVIRALARAVAGVGEGVAAPLIFGAESAGEAGTATATYDFAQTVTGAEIVSHAAEVGLDTSSELSVIVQGAEGSLDAGTVIGPDTEIVIVGAAIETQAGSVIDNPEFAWSIEAMQSLITNANAEEVASNFVHCDKSNWRVRPGTLKQEYTGMMVRPDLHELRHPQEYEKSRGGDKAPGSPRPEHEDSFITEEVVI